MDGWMDEMGGLQLVLGEGKYYVAFSCADFLGGSMAFGLLGRERDLCVFLLWCACSLL